MFREFIPKSYLYLKSGYRFSLFRKDLIAGLAVGVVALPLAMALAIASGVTPERGLYTAIIAGFLISAAGGSRIQIGGPTGAFVIIIYEIVQKNGYNGLAIATMLAAVILILFGLFRLGTWIKYIPHPLVIGLTTAIALLIFSTQVKDFFGLQIAEVPVEFFEKWKVYLTSFSSIHLPTFFLSGSTLAVIILVKKFAARIPWAIVAIVYGTVVCQLFHLPVETIHSRFGDLPSALPLPFFPHIDFAQLNLSEVFIDAITIAFLAAIESLLSAIIGDGMIGSQHKSNSELVGQGIANFGSVLFGGLPATGAIARTAMNVKCGGQTPVAGMVHAAVLCTILLFFSSVVSQIPLASLSAVLIMISWNMAELKHFTSQLKTTLGDAAILISAFLLTVFVDITIAITFGMILASFLFMKKMSSISKTVHLTKIFDERSEFLEKLDPDAISLRSVPEKVEVYEIQGPFFFGAADILNDVLHNLEQAPKVFILRMRYVPFIDASGMHALQEFYEKCQRNKTVLILSGIQTQTQADLMHFGLDQLIGKSSIFPHIDDALAKAKEIVESS